MSSALGFISQAFFHSGITADEEKLIAADRKQRDLSLYKLTSVLATVVCGMALLAALLVPSLTENLWVYIVFVVIFGLQAFCSSRIGLDISDRIFTALKTFSLISMYAIGITLGIYNAENNLAVTLIAMLIIGPSMYTISPFRSFVPSFACVILFCILANLTKSAELAATDAVDAILFLIVGVVLGYFHVHTRLTSMIYARKVSEMSVTDALTGLKNRAAFTQQIANLALPDAMPRDLCIVSIDVNGLKAVNDTLLHEAGDELLCGAAACMREAFAHSDVYRLGGDEFAVVSFESEEQTATRIRMLQDLAATWRGEKVHHLSLAVGAASHEEMPDADGSALLKEADRRMYGNKAAYYQTSGRDRRAR